MARGDTVVDWREEFGTKWADFATRFATAKVTKADVSQLLCSIAEKHPVVGRGAGWPEDHVPLTQKQQDDVLRLHGIIP